MTRMNQRAEYYLAWVRGNIGKVLLGLLVLLMLATSVKTIKPEEQGVVLFLGRFNRTVQPGLSFIAPLGLEKMYKIPIQRQLKLEFGFRTVTPGVRTVYSDKDFGDESLMLTGDLNLADVEWVVQYRIMDSYKYLFKVRDAEDALRDMSEAAMRKVVGDRTVNEVLTVGRQAVASNVETLLQQMCVEYENGLQIEQVVLQDVNPPEKVKPSFNAVNQAQQERETLINQAESEYNQVIPRARGEAEETIQLAEAYALNRVNRAIGEADRFSSLYAEYIKAPEVTKKRLYFEILERILPKIGDKIVVDEKGNNVLPLLNMDRKINNPIK
ncbi:MAG: FtsH protease activity modulator HflK [Porphyromonadaceae bacterium]|nr:MAG: FtsH protease activity modulator HflK [Porphyromonadaceae bacterium]